MISRGHHVSPHLFEERAAVAVLHAHRVAVVAVVAGNRRTGGGILVADRDGDQPPLRRRQHPLQPHQHHWAHHVRMNVSRSPSQELLLEPRDTVADLGLDLTLRSHAVPPVPERPSKIS